jgi:adenine phosphoribosyltransferase
LPYDVRSINYDLEYGSATLEVHTDGVKKGDRVLVIDDLLATGGTAKASCELIESLGAEVVACAFMVELDALKGRERLSRWETHALVHY